MKQDVACERSSQPVASSAGDLSHDVLAQAAQRLGAVAVGVGGLVLLVSCYAYLVDTLTDWGAPAGAHPALAWTSRLALLALSAGLWALCRARGATHPRQVLDLGLLYQVLGAALISLPAYWGDHFLDDTPGRMAWLGVWIVLFPLVVPAPPLKTLAVALISAATAPIVFGVWVTSRGAPWPASPVLASTFLPYVFCALLAGIPAWLTWRLNISICDARAQAKALGSYQLKERLGVGGMGEVWRAEHRMLARPAAIKLIKSDSLKAGSSAAERQTTLARFEREARATAALESPHTIGLYDYGVTDGGTFYYVMELLQGVDMETLVRDHGRLCPARAVYLLRQVCASLAEAHRRGLIHRDIKPANVFVCRLGVELDFVKVLDFGLVRRAQGTASDDAGSVNLTGEGYVVGTPAFMAPEQAEAAGTVDERADIYALGCVGYWLLTGKLVFDHEAPMRVLVDHIKTPPPPPSTHLPEPLPADLEALILACLAKSPLERPAGAEVLAERLAACAVPAWSQAEALSWWQAHRPLVLAGATPESSGFDVYASTVAVPAPAAEPLRG